MNNADPVINTERLRQLLDGVNAFGFNAVTGGYNRVGYSAEDMAVRDWFADQMTNDGLEVSRDGVNNLFGRYGPDTGPCVMAGSHLDTVPEGGAFDGSLGVCIALECVRAMQDAGIEPRTPIVVAVTAEEEGRFGGMFGSQTIVGAVTPDWIEKASDSDGVRLVDAMAAQGLDAHAAMSAAWEPGSIRAFLELHIEQGPVLERSAIPVGIVEAIAGVCNLQVRYTGTANHSGTTPMDMRADAFAGLAAFASTIAPMLKAHGSGQSRITIGKVELSPNHAHTIPGAAEFLINLRDTSETVMRELRAECLRNIDIAAAAHGLTSEVREKSWLSPVSLDSGIRDIFNEEADRLGYKSLVMPSGAGHDAQTMQSLCPSGLIFIPSRNGISHAPEEWSDWADIEKGAQLMLNALVRLSTA
ncbi:MAG: Zn-dependent hydrolase [Hoeflea sp.]|uniref:Zn-dependent hydrolase n=1 Tax=Hoeflea sp. TaxID=1940281 RepID=UPI001D245A84|nr:Zn-dependent hydrolase [Hoeflea sp.]MBU4529232.1 Zn-dependent hydrolase [Alphaproteobacteria bacterium]MBU4543636.1 Zn-dependent hydrolase [Alphaproteobacteria bacterium]MBU4549262.1 Zn-dependent hydrolase [Alphaproteobacteria bacterium]MBV1725395.1 Zn-dependent hydrolase [Hoeflea sp.]MBV1785358.1 Zn-dependent hydrolase [Hoeflea sp.]